jgi:AcrR family transcriptional regulator
VGESRQESPQAAPTSRRRGNSGARYDALLSAARSVFAGQGINGSLEEVARRAGVGIGTLYRNFPSRQALVEAVYVDEVEALARLAGDGDGDPWRLLAIWLRQFLDYATTKRAVIEGLNTDSPLFAACIDLIHQAGEPLLARAQTAGVVRLDVDFDDVRRLISGVAAATYTDDGQRERVLGVALDGLRVQG